MDAIYYEEDWIARVQIIDNTSDEEVERYKLKVVETIEKGIIINSHPNGHIFDVEQVNDGLNERFELIHD